MPRLLEAGPPEVRELLEVGLDDAPGAHLLPALRARVAASIVAGGAATSTIIATTAIPAAESATTSGMFTKATASGVGTVAKATLSLTIGKALVGGLALGSALCGGAMLSGFGQASTRHASMRTESTIAPGKAHRSLTRRRPNDSASSAPPAVLGSTTRSGSEATATVEDDPARRAGATAEPNLSSAALGLPSPALRAAVRSKQGNGVVRHDTATPAALVEPEALGELKAPSTSAAALPTPPNLLALEIARIDQARALLNAGNPSAALAALKAHESTSHGAVLGREAMIIRIEALLAQGDRKGARFLAVEYLARYPQDVHSARMRYIESEINRVE